MSQKKKSGRLADDWLSSFVEYTEGTESPRLFYFWSGVATIAGALQRKVSLDRGILDTLYPNFYIILVGPAGGRKGPAVGIAGKFLRKLEVNMIHGKTTPEGLMRQMQDAGISTKNEDSEFRDKKETLIVPECIAFIESKELSSLFGRHTYVEDLIIFLTDVWDCPDHWDYSTQKRGKAFINNAYVNMLGASNPEWLAKAFRDDAFGGGFMGRTIFVYQDEYGRVPRPTLTEKQKELEYFLTFDLQHISTLRGKMKLSDEAGAFFDKWYMELDQPKTGRMARYYKTKHVHVLKLAMILSISEDDSLIVKTKHLAAAIKHLSVLEEFIPDALALVGATNEARIAEYLLNILRANRGRVRYDKVIQKIRRIVRSKNELLGIISLLVEDGSLKFLKSSDGDRYFALTDRYMKKEAEKRKKANDKN